MRHGSWVGFATWRRPIVHWFFDDSVFSVCGLKAREPTPAAEHKGAHMCRRCLLSGEVPQEERVVELEKEKETLPTSRGTGGGKC